MKRIIAVAEIVSISASASFFILLFSLCLLALVSCGGKGGAGASAPIPQGCVEVGSITNTGGPLTIIANCVNGAGNVTQTCFTTGAAGEQPVPVPCNNGGPGQVVNGPTPTS